MLRIFKNYDGRVTEITSMLQSVNLSRSLTEVSRKLECTMLYPIQDIYQPHFQVGASTKVWVTLDNKEIFRGVVIDRSISSNDTLSFTAFDYGWYLNKNKVTYNFSNTTADRAVRQILKEIGIEANKITESNIKLRWLIAQKSVYDAIMELYTQVSKQTKKKYFICMSGTKVNVVELGSKLTNHTINKDTEPNLINFEYKDSMQNVVNRVKIYDDKNNYKSLIEDKKSITRYGIIQDNIVKEKDKDSTVIARNMLKGLEKEVTCTVLGNWDYRTGYAAKVNIRDIESLRNVLMYIIEDSHTWDMSTGTYTTDLTLSYYKKMDIKDSNDTVKFDTKLKKEVIRADKKKKALEKKKIREAKRKERQRKALEKKKLKQYKSKNKIKIKKKKVKKNEK